MLDMSYMTRFLDRSTATDFQKVHWFDIANLRSAECPLGLADVCVIRFGLETSQQCLDFFFEDSAIEMIMGSNAE